MARIVFVEDSDPIRQVVTEYLKLDNHEVSEFAAGDLVVQFVRNDVPHLCILDLMVPGVNGFQIAKEIRAFSDVPILFLTARDDEASRITGFEIGGDDYIVKPFSPRELVLRVNAILRRAVGGSARTTAPSLLRASLGDERLSLVSAEHRAFLNDEEIGLTATEWRILQHFMVRPGQVVTREQLMESVLDYSPESNTRTVDSHIKNLRAKLRNHGWISTVRSMGYRFSGENPSP